MKISFVRLVATLAALSILPASAAIAQQQSRNQQRCITNLNRNLQGVATTLGKEIASCFRDESKGKLSTSIDECFREDRRGRVARAALRTIQKEAKDCTTAPDFGVSDADTVNDAAVEKELALIADVFGSEVDGVVIELAANRIGSKCQQAVVKALRRCQDTVLREFNACKRAGLKDGSIVGTAGLEACVGVDSRGKVARACDVTTGKIRAQIDRRCEERGVDLSDAFPGCGTDEADDLSACATGAVECRSCRALVEADGLSTNCDLLDDGLGNGSCGGVATLAGAQVVLPSDAEPDETPGSPGVVVTNPELLTQFEDPNFNLNNAIYTRWRAAGSAATPDAILIVVAGFGGGANNFKPLAENLIGRATVDHGLTLEVWGFHRRTNQLEDRAGSFIAEGLEDPLIALDWYYGAELGLTLAPELVADPNRRAFFYNKSDDIPFIANFTNQVFSRDIDVIVDAAIATATNGNVFLAGHSAGTGFVARYASTDFDLTGGGPAEPGYAKLRGLVLLEGGGGSTGQVLSEDSLDRIEAKADGGLFAAVRDAAPRCQDGSACTVATEAVDCSLATPPKCIPSQDAYAAVAGLGPEITAASEIIAIQRINDPETGIAIVQEDQGAPGNNAVAVVPGLGLLGIVPDSTVDGLFGTFLDDDGPTATFLSPAIATAMGAPGPVVGGLVTWLDISEGPFGAGIVPDNGPAPTTLPGGLWGQEVEVVDIDRLGDTFLSDGANAADWYFASAGLGTTSATGACDEGLCDTNTTLCTSGPSTGAGCSTDEDCGVCTAGDIGATCDSTFDCSQSISLDSTQLSVGRGRRDIVNLTEAASIDIPVICFGGSNGLLPVPARFVPFAESIGACSSPSCDGFTSRLVDANAPNPAFPTFGDVDGGFEVYISEGFAHNDVVAADDVPGNLVIKPLSDFIARNIQ